ncbi:hypothetical protein [Leptolyngbya sp. NIES-2104]|uniref:hypothetical protein n=1 Tax=Leptolyngbya sp. NIES-2104 TaxID=1552121 RepID=UPI0006EC4C52|nr:hypothetical protein [Leptolyngbya sp. NIES-2104]GAP93778.1 hypothetical protein NIES2104_02860 [Leptolyngbya sp. NIES-2104]
MSEQADPKATDLVMGAAMPPPINAVALGGVEGLRQRFALASLDQKRELLPLALNYHEVGIDFLIDAVSDAELIVRAEACELLAKVNSGKAESAIDRGIPLVPGDRVYGVYQSSVSYGDDWYYINCLVDEEEEEEDLWDDKPDFYRVGQTKEGKEFVYVSDVPQYDQSMSEYAYYHPSLIHYCIEQIAAEEAARAVYCNHFSNLYCEIHEIGETWAAPDINLRTWVETNKITVDAIFSEDQGGWGDHERQYRCSLLMSLHRQKQFNLLRELWDQLEYSPLGFVHECVIDRPCYLRLSNHHVRT